MTTHPQPAATHPASWNVSERVRRVAAHPSTWAALSILVWWAIKYWPVPIHPAGYQPGPPGDGWGGTSIWRAMVEGHVNPFAPGRIHAFNAPDGLPVPWQVDIQQWPSTLMYYGVTWLTGDADVAQNVYMLTGYLGTAAAMAWLIYRFVTADRWIAALCGFLLAFGPLIAVKAPAHTAFVHLWPLVLTLGLTLALLERPSYHRAAAAGAMAFVSASWSGYHLIFTLMLFGTVIVFGVLSQVRTREGRRTLLLTTAASVGTLGALLALEGAILLLVGHGADPTSAVTQRSLDALYVYGARWYEYLVPPPHAVLLGDSTASYYSTRMHGSNAAESTLYLGISVLVVGLIGLWSLLARRGAPLRTPQRLLFIAGPVLALLAGYWSLPPKVSPAGFTLPTPSLAAYHFVTTWRVYARFVVVVEIGLIVLVAVGLVYLAGRGRRRVAVLLVASVLLPLDLAVHTDPPVKATAPAMARPIAALPPGDLAVYPLTRGEEDGYGQLYNEQYYGRGVVNGFDDQPEESQVPLISDISQNQTVRRLAALNVRYVAVIARPTAAQPTAPPAKPASLLKPLFTSTYGPYPVQVMEVPEIPGAVHPTTSTGFGKPEAAPGQPPLTWATNSKSSIIVHSDCHTACRGTLRIQLVPFGPPRTISVSSGGRPVNVRLDGRTSHGSIRLTKPATASIPMALVDTQTIELDVTPGPVAVKSVSPDSADARSLTIGVQAMAWTASR
jgi:hypothetical protein